MKHIKLYENILTDIIKSPYTIAKKIKDTVTEIGDEYKNEGDRILAEYEIVAKYIIQNSDLRIKTKLKIIDSLNDILFDYNLEFYPETRQEILKLKTNIRK